MTDSLWSVHVIMPGPSCGHRAHQKVIDEKDVLPYVQPAGACHCFLQFLVLSSSIEASGPCPGPHIGNYYSTYSDDLSPLSSFRSLPANLFALTQPNGDVILHYGGGEEADFDVIGMVIGTCLEVPSGFPKSVPALPDMMLVLIDIIVDLVFHISVDGSSWVPSMSRSFRPPSKRVRSSTTFWLCLPRTSSLSQYSSRDQPDAFVRRQQS